MMQNMSSCVKIQRNTISTMPYPQPVVAQQQSVVDLQSGRDHKKEECPEHQKEECPKDHKKDYCPPQPNPAIPMNATLPLLTPVAVTQRGNVVLVTASIPAEAIITLPHEALEIKRISKKLKITQLRFFAPPAAIVPGAPVDFPKLFIGGFVRKDIQFTEPKYANYNSVAGDVKDFVIDIPVSGVVNLGTGLTLPTTVFDQDREYEFARRRRLGTGFADKDRLLSPDFTEFNMVSNKFLNRLPVFDLVFSQINEMDDQLDRIPLCNGPFEEASFRTLQEKMVILVQIRMTFPELPTAGVEECKCCDCDC